MMKNPEIRTKPPGSLVDLSLLVDIDLMNDHVLGTAVQPTANSPGSEIIHPIVFHFINKVRVRVICIKCLIEI